MTRYVADFKKIVEDHHKSNKTYIAFDVALAKMCLPPYKMAAARKQISENLLPSRGLRRLVTEDKVRPVYTSGRRPRWTLSPNGPFADISRSKALVAVSNRVTGDMTNDVETGLFDKSTKDAIRTLAEFVVRKQGLGRKEYTTQCNAVNTILKALERKTCSEEALMNEVDLLENTLIDRVSEKVRRKK